MKKLTPFVISCLLVFGVAACDNASKTSESAPNNPNEAPQTPTAKTTEASQQDAQSEVRRRQANSDIRAREQRNNTTGGDTKRAKADLESEVRSKLEVNIPKSQLTVNAADGGIVTVAGTVTNQQELAKIEKLAKEIKGVNSVIVKATVAKVTN
ncbi:MAG: BON domain-containing protein [Nostoc sp.]|uniref:BON domain-containing protein n=1 Tax=unclassified Nostoc TaxID=2593658 RepID=UPI000C054CC2|nr:BON domain-containing protein [Nostoc sp. 'Peltigera malacea cyanobiont' DB3992]PHM07002.1 transporter [Nostoc sp. 'Peltigera malacea cyanobiont' DB3992]